MKKTIIQTTLVLLILSGSILARGQQNIQASKNEHVVVFTDRNLYISGEKVDFSAFVISGNYAVDINSSQILYCELVTPDGNKVAAGKYLCSDNSVCGSIVIPEDAVTGNYYFRAYTKVMRNFGPANYHYTAIKIVNPYRNEVLPGNFSETDTLRNHKPENNGNLFDIKVEKTVYSPRDTVSVIFQQVDAAASNLKGTCLSVVPEASVTSTEVSIPHLEPFSNKSYIYPETRGLSITGMLTDNTSGKPVPGTRVNLSIIGHGRDFMAITTDTAGRFFFSLPDYTGFRDLFLCAANSNSLNSKIQVDNDFCTLPVRLSSPLFTLTEQERETAYNMAVNRQLSGHFAGDTIRSIPEAEAADKAFYGTPTEILNLDNYIQLPTSEEYFNELPTLVKVRKKQGKKYFKILGNESALNVFDPLVLIDWVAVDDPEKILAVSPQNIARIEIINVPYIKGDQTYGGIVSIISKRGDFAGIDLPSSGIFINYRFLDSPIGYEIKQPNLLHQPDTRNTLLWQPNLNLKDGKARFKLAAPDTPGKYLIVVRGISHVGNTYIQTRIFEVR